MDKKLASRIAGGNTEYKRSDSDFYPTPPEVTKALMDFIQLPKDMVIWEPACGEHHMSDVMKKMGYQVLESDIKYGDDFLSTPFKDCDWIITNPPFSLSEDFIWKCHEYNKPFALLLKSQYWHAKKRLKIFRETKPTYIMPLTWRPDFCFKERGKGSPLMDVIWVIWDSEFPRSYPLYIPLEKPKME